MAEERWVISNDNEADWAMKKIKAEYDETERLINIAKEQIEELNMEIERLNTECENKVSYYRGCLCEYFMTVPHKETKTQESYKLLHGSLVLKKASNKINHDDEKLVAWLKESGREEFLNTKVTPKWAEIKENLTIVDGKVVDTTTGEEVEACSVEETPEHFELKL